MHRAPQRSYTPRAIESWFDRLNQDWEDWFTAEELQWGRQYYRTGEVRSTELLEGSAIIHFRQGKEPLYVIVDWEREGPTFRESHPGTAPGRGLGVAGMYELEELIADEVSPLEEMGDPSESGEGADGLPGQRPAEASAPTERTGRALRVRLTTRTDGLWLEAGWEEEHGATDWKRFTLRELTRWEREQLIGFTARAHRCGFRPGDREGVYRMQEPGSVQRFLARDLDEWKRRYRLEEGDGLEAWKAGVRILEPWLQVRAEGDQQGRFHFDFRDGRGRVSADIRDRVLRHPGHTHFVPGRGIFRADPGMLDSIHEWKAILPGGGEGVLPRYLLFSLARDPGVQLSLTEELAAWQRQLETEGDLGERDGLPEILRPYQREGVSWLDKLAGAGCHGLLADEMGLGKTVQVLSLLKAREVLGTHPVLVVCPASVVPVWRAEVERFFPDTEVRVLSRQQPFEAGRPVLWIASYTQLRRNKAQLDNMAFTYAVLDEAQSIKNPDAKVTHACMAIRAGNRIALTGTPMENRPLDLWTLFRFLMPGFLGSRRYFENLSKSDEAFVRRLRRQIAPFVLRRTKGAVARDLPPKVEFDWTCPLSPVQRRLYQDLVAGAGEALGADLGGALKEKRMHLFSLLTRLRQACCDPGILPHRTDDWTQSGKLSSLTDRLEEALEGGSKVVVFSQFVQFLRRARKAVRSTFPDVPQLELTGATLDRERPVRRFRELDGAAVFFVSLRAGGTGLNLQMADYVFLMDPWWNPAVEAQAIDRAHRLGRERRVIVYRMVTEGTIEQRIQALKREKGRVFDELLDDLDAPVDVLSHFRSLHELIALEEASGPERDSQNSTPTRV
jgi:superfamily II DNA or RNA helicase